MVAGDIRARIERRAYELWEAEGRPQGRELEHWLRAEAELKGHVPAPFKPKPPAPLPAREKPKRPPGPSSTPRRH
jgi:Protein of unknown function (DUF2934)